jgi:hypothetical protein
VNIDIYFHVQPKQINNYSTPVNATCYVNQCSNSQLVSDAEELLNFNGNMSEKYSEVLNFNLGGNTRYPDSFFHQSTWHIQPNV